MLVLKSTKILIHNLFWDNTRKRRYSLAKSQSLHHSTDNGFPAYSSLDDRLYCGISNDPSSVDVIISVAVHFHFPITVPRSHFVDFIVDARFCCGYFKIAYLRMRLGLFDYETLCFWCKFTCIYQIMFVRLISKC